MGFLINNTTQMTFNRVYWAPRALESASWELALKPSLYNNHPIHSNSFRPGNTHFPRTWCLARGNTHIPRTSVSPTSATGFREPPNKPAWPRETPYTTVDVFPMDSVLFNPIYPAWASIPLRLWGLTPTFRTLTNAVWVLPKQAHKSLYSKHRSLALLSVLLTYFPSFWNNTIHLIRSLIINTYRFPSIGRTLHNITLSHKHNRSALSKNTRQTEYFPLSPQGSPPVRRESPATTQGR